MNKLTTALLILFALPAAAQQQALTPLQQFLYNESGYAPPAQQTVQQAYEEPVYAQQQQVYVPPPQQVYAPPVQNAAPEGYYEDEGSDVGPSSESPSLRALMTSSGF